MNSQRSSIEHQAIERDTTTICRIDRKVYCVGLWSRWRFGVDHKTSILLEHSGNLSKYQFAYSHFVNESTIELSNGTTAVRYKSTIIDYRKTEHPSYMAMWNDIDRNQWKIDKFFKFRKNLHFICVNDKIDHSAEGRLKYKSPNSLLVIGPGPGFHNFFRS